MRMWLCLHLLLKGLHRVLPACAASRIAQAFAQEIEQLVLRKFSDRLPTANERSLQSQVASLTQTLAECVAVVAMLHVPALIVVTISSPAAARPSRALTIACDDAG
jgi:hypothetical protein